MEIKYPVKVKVTAQFLEELWSCEQGRHQDAEEAREAGDQEAIKRCDYDCVFNDFSGRHKTVIECRNNKELAELYYVCASGTIGVRGFTRQANRVLDEIRDKVVSFDPDLVRQWPKQDGI